MNPFTLAVNLFRGGPQRTQYHFGHSQSHFALAREDILRPSLVQGRAFTYIGRASEDPDSRVQPPCQANHLGTGVQAGSAENEAASAAHPGTLQGLAVACIAVDRCHAGLAQAAHGVPIQLDDGRLNIVVLEETRDGLADWAVTHHDGSVAGAGRRRPVRDESGFRGNAACACGS